MPGALRRKLGSLPWPHHGHVIQQEGLWACSLLGDLARSCCTHQKMVIAALWQREEKQANPNLQAPLHNYSLLPDLACLMWYRKDTHLLGQRLCELFYSSTNHLLILTEFESHSSSHQPQCETHQVLSPFAVQRTVATEFASVREHCLKLSATWCWVFLISLSS